MQNISKSKNTNPEKFIIYILLVMFIITEIVDLVLDQVLGNSILHSGLQLFLFLFLFIFTYRLFIKYTNKKIKKLIPEELMQMLRIIKNEKRKGILINQRKMGEILDITKPTLKKRIDALLELQYISFEEKGNHRYFILTALGDSISG